MKKIIKYVLEKRRAFNKERRIKIFLRNKSIPWSLGYNDYKWNEIEKAISNNEILIKYKENKEIIGVGINIDERIIEIPWFISKLKEEKTKLLDAGSSLNHEIILQQPIFSIKETTIYTYFPEPLNFNQKRISYVYGDLRELPFKDTFFDEIVCISTLEHIDMDNSMYGYEIKNHENPATKSYEYLRVIQEFLRVLNANGNMIITVPYGKFENHGFFQQFDEEMVSRIVEMTNPFGTIAKKYFRYTQSGWQTASAEECKNEKSYNPHTGIGKGIDNAAHSRAICCVFFNKDK